VVVGARNPERIREHLQLLLGDSDLYEVRAAACDGVEELVLDSPHGDLVIAERSAPLTLAMLTRAKGRGTRRTPWL
jgi:hypothetical protein